MIRILSSLATLLLSTIATAQLTCSTTVVAPSCGPIITVTFTPIGGAGNQRIDVSAAGLHPNAQGVMNWGATQVFAQLPGGCPLLCDFVWGHKFVANDSGEFSWQRSWPHYYQYFWYMQVGTWDLVAGNLEFRTTNLVLAGCQ
ncbi:MAG TPA: hypothetical protein VF384_12235 [Planctomycetota bacterium]